MKYKEPIKYGFIKCIQFRFLESLRQPTGEELSPFKYNTGIGAPNPPPPSQIFYNYPSTEKDPPPLKEKKKDPTKDYYWPAAVKSNGGLRGSKATSRRRFR